LLLLLLLGWAHCLWRRMLLLLLLLLHLPLRAGHSSLQLTAKLLLALAGLLLLLLLQQLAEELRLNHIERPQLTAVIKAADGNVRSNLQQLPKQPAVLLLQLLLLCQVPWPQQLLLCDRNLMLPLTSTCCRCCGGDTSSSAATACSSSCCSCSW
jgi:hypothetical protein